MVTKNPKQFYDSIHEKENSIINLKKRMVVDRKEFYNLGFKDGYQKALQDQSDEKGRIEEFFKAVYESIEKEARY